MAPFEMSHIILIDYDVHIRLTCFMVFIPRYVCTSEALCVAYVYVVGLPSVSRCNTLHMRNIYVSLCHMMAGNKHIKRKWVHDLDQTFFILIFRVSCRLCNMSIWPGYAMIMLVCTRGKHLSNVTHDL